MTLDINNAKQIALGSHMYTAENDDRLAHPTWGGDLSGSDGWAYLTSKKSRAVPGATLATPTSAAGKDINSTQFTNQLAFFKVSQVGQYLNDVKSTWCPKDVATRGGGRLKQLWLDRPVKVTSYCWNGTIGGYVGSRGSAPTEGKTYKVSDFLPTDWQFWEQNENMGFYFNDAGNNPESLGETVSFRHSGAGTWWTFQTLTNPNLPGGAVVGTFGGTAQFVKWNKTHSLVTQKVPFPNEILNGPRYQR